MKSIKKFLFIMVALATALAFVSCSNGDDDGGSSTVATYTAVEDDKVLTFFSDGTWVVTGYDGGKKVDWSKGTYLGHPEVNDKIEIKYTKYYDKDFAVYKDGNPDYSEIVKIIDGLLQFDYSADNDYIDFKRK